MTEPYWQSPDGRHVLYQGDCLAVLPTLAAGSVQCCITSPPYWGLRDYNHPDQLGLEPTSALYVAHLVRLFQAVHRVLRDDGTLWLNLGDSYAGYHGNSKVPDADAPSNKPGYVENMRSSTVVVSALKAKDLVGTPWRVAFALQADGWYLRSEIIWHKVNAMPESVTDRPTKAHEQVFLLAKNARYYYASDVIAEEASSVGRIPSGGGAYIWQGANGHNKDGLRDLGKRPVTETRNKRSVWSIPTQPFPGAHFATMPPALVQPCLLAGCPPDGLVLDPFAGAGTVALMAIREGRQSVSIELNPEYCAIAVTRLEAELAQPLLFPPAAFQDPVQETLL